MDIRAHLRRHRITSTDLAVGIGLKRSTVNNKLLGIRPWKVGEAIAVARFIRKRTGQHMTVERLFGKAA
jgi:lambda repressor-like predicted transcriptional regulator